ncbi:MAG: four-helix bundle copper-binding protein [Bacteroidia bacterium]
MKSEAKNDLLHQLIKCITACETCATMCINEGSEGKAVCINTDRDCADLCALLTRYIGRNSQFTDETMKMAVGVIKKCEAECRKHDDDHCQKCAEVCHATHKALEEFQSR